ncbi:MAG: hypothetical protein N4A63_00455 [Vallitalea sp.]|jgi:hypothetical protein|nr:hypothetical protein [Vallitalea sp.]
MGRSRCKDGNANKWLNENNKERVFWIVLTGVLLLIFIAEANA